MEIELEEALEREDLQFIDVRSPGEYAAASIPGAVNVPLFNDNEHHELGLAYRLQGEKEARRVALEIAAPRLPSLVQAIQEACRDRIPLLYCRRGGMRSLSLYQVMTLAGVEVLRLKKGYRAFRKHVNTRLGSYRLESRLLVLHGLTGVGKTVLLKMLEERDLPTVDLEELAGHRGSVFGTVGIGAPKSQKDFDALLLNRLDRLKGEPCLAIEGEGRRIGNIFLPPFLVKAMEGGTQVLLTAPLPVRARRIVATYIQVPLPGKTLEELRGALRSLHCRLGEQKTSFLEQKINEGDYLAVAETLCSAYYDHFYSDSKPEHATFAAVIDATCLEKAVVKISELMKTGVCGLPAHQ